MNDPDCRRWPDGFDDDAIFADIVAHMNDEAKEAEGAAEPPVEHAATDVEPAGVEPNDTTAETKAESTAESTDLPPGDRPPTNWNQWPINSSPGPPAHSHPQAIPPPQPWRAPEVDDESEEHFEPPPVTPLPAGDLGFWAIIAGMCGGPLLLLYLVFFNPDASNYWILSAIAMSVGGFALLVSRMPGHHDDDDGARL